MSESSSLQPTSRTGMRGEECGGLRKRGMRIRITRLRNEVMGRRGMRIRMKRLRNEVMRRMRMRIRIRRLRNEVGMRQ